MDNKILGILLMLCCSSAWSYRIMMVCAPPTRSHYNLCSAVTNILAERNHDVTFITAFSANKPTKYREILVDMSEILEKFSPFNMSNMSMREKYNMLMNVTPRITNSILNDEKVIKIMNDKSEKFDLLILEYMGNQNLLGLSVKYDCPAVLLTSITILPWVATATGNPLAIATVPNAMSVYPRNMNIWQRTVNTLRSIIMDGIDTFLLSPKLKSLYEKDFPEESKIVPYTELRLKVSGVLSNSHHSIGIARPLLPNVAEIAGYHIEKPAPLPDDLKKIMDSAKDGVIFFSLGSIVKPKEMSPESKEAIVQSLSKFKQTVLWKFDEEIKDLPKNIITRKWLPQTSILAHPNLKLFITHGGFLSCTEATHFGVPMMLIPVFGDQHHNAKIFTDNGQGLSIDFKEITEESLTSSVTEILNNPKYAETSKKVSERFHDRPINPRDLLAYHVEHIIKTGGGSHMSSPRLPVYSYLLLDVILVLLISILSVVLIMCWACKKMCKGFCNRFCKSQNKIKKT